jgi:hypothetical protein
MRLLASEPHRLRAASGAIERYRRDYDAQIVGPELWSFLQAS